MRQPSPIGPASGVLLAERAAQISMVLALFVTGAAVIVLTGWTFGIVPAENLMAGTVTVKPNTAISLLLCALAILLRHVRQTSVPRRLSVIFPASAILIGVLTLGEYVFHAQMHIDELFFSVGSDALLTDFPGRMAYVTAIVILLLGIGISLRNHDHSGPGAISQISLLLAGSLALTALLTYVYGAIPTAGLGQGVQIAIPTAICTVFLAASALLLDPGRGWVSRALSAQPGGTLRRRLIPFAFLVPFTIGLVRTVSSSTGALSAATQAAIVAVMTMVAFGFLIWRTAAVVDAETAHVKRLQGLLPICSHCRLVRNETDYWQQVDQYLIANTDVELTHSICPECLKEEMAKVDALGELSSEVSA
ncbi:MAG: hypothetical protein M3Z17_05900 [Gemmatimonadota bacterium]|nr:hypothetical protein [Gemmatimonadota bacterium]